jgi:glycosyltransferase involved in cell wall biosynthesis
LKVSILTPYKNSATYIAETARSIFEQTYQNWEWILINDDSSENEEQILEKYLNDPKVTLLKNKGAGIIDALITGFELASGEYITRMDADDLMPTTKLSSFVHHLNTTNTDIVTGKVSYFSTTNQISEGYKKYQEWLNQRIDLQDFENHIYRECILSSGNWLIRTQKLREVGGFSGLIYPEDYDLVFRWHQYGLKIVGINQLTHLWRDHHLRTSKTSQNYQQKAFFELKIKRFLDLKKSNTKLVLNGTGQKGRLTAKILLQHHVNFTWVSHEAEKYPLGIFNQHIHSVVDIPKNTIILILNTTLIENNQVLAYYGNKIDVEDIVML